MNDHSVFFAAAMGTGDNGRRFLPSNDNNDLTILRPPAMWASDVLVGMIVE